MKIHDRSELPKVIVISSGDLRRLPGLSNTCSKSSKDKSQILVARKTNTYDRSIAAKDEAQKIIGKQEVTEEDCSAT